MKDKKPHLFKLLGNFIYNIYNPDKAICKEKSRNSMKCRNKMKGTTSQASGPDGYGVF